MKAKWKTKSYNPEYVVLVEGDTIKYGFDDRGHYFKGEMICPEHLVETTKEHALVMLKREARRRGLIEGAKFRDVIEGEEWFVKNTIQFYGAETDRRIMLTHGKENGLIFLDGKWAKVISDQSYEGCVIELEVDPYGDSEEAAISLLTLGEKSSLAAGLVLASKRSEKLKEAIEIAFTFQMFNE